MACPLLSFAFGILAAGRLDCQGLSPCVKYGYSLSLIFPHGSDWLSDGGLQTQVSSEKSFQVELALSVAVSLFICVGADEAGLSLILIHVSRYVSGCGVAVQCWPLLLTNSRHS